MRNKKERMVQVLQANFANKIVYGEGSLEFLEQVDMSRIVVFADRIFCEYNKDVLELMDSIFSPTKSIKCRNSPEFATAAVFAGVPSLFSLTGTIRLLVPGARPVSTA